MIGIAATLVAALLGLCLLCIFSLRRAGKPEVPFTQEGVSVPGLTAAVFPDPEILSGKEDYRKLLGTPVLRSVGEKFRKDRRRIVLMWLGELENDVGVLWEFRRFLVRNGLSVTLREELVVASTGVIAVVYLRLVRVTIVLCGPFVLPKALRNARSLVQLLSSRELILLARVPAPRKAEIERKWAQHLLLMRAG